MMRKSLGIAVILLALSPGFATTVVRVYDPAKDWTSLMECVDTLWTGSFDEKLIALENLESLVWIAEMSEPAQERRLVANLISWLRQEKSEWILDQVVYQLVDAEDSFEEGHWDPFYLAALAHRSPNVRRRAVEHAWYCENPDVLPALEKLWSSEKRPWVRAELMEAFAYQESAAHLSETLEALEADDEVLVHGALWALTDLLPPEAIPALVRRSTHGRASIRDLALRVLNRFPDRREGLEATLAATRDAGVPMQRAAIRHLARYEDRVATGRLLEVLEDPFAHPRVRMEALLHVEWNGEPAKRAREQIGIDGLDDQQLRILVRGISDLMDRLPEGSVMHARAFVEEDALFDEEPSYRVSGRTSVRCWNVPNHAAPAARTRRIPAGERVEVGDYFEDGEQTWAHVSPRYCWLPLDALEKSEDGAAEVVLSHIEFDVLNDLLELPEMARLIESGRAELFDPSDNVTGVVVALEPLDLTVLDDLTTIAALTGGLLAEQLAPVLQQLRSGPN